MKIVKKILKWLFLVVIILNALIIFPGKTYLYKAVANTYLKGRGGPTISEYTIFSNREVKASPTPQEWPLSTRYNKKTISENNIHEFEKYETIAYLIVKNDSIIYEQYWDGYNENSITNSFSMAKTFVSMLVGIAIEEGKIKSMDDPVANYLPDYSSEDGKKLTIKHLLTMSSGINFDENYKNPLAYPAYAYYGTDLKELTYKYKITEEPGKVFKYLSGNTELLALTLEKAVGKPISEYASEKLWIPMGAKNTAYWSLDHENGMEKAYCCFNSNARDFSRFGQLYLKNGNWKGKQLVPEQYVKNSIKPADLLTVKGKKNKIYGYSWWLVDYKNHNLFYARGIAGQYIFVIPDMNMVVVRLGKKRDMDYEDHPDDIFIYLDAALEMF